MILRIDPEKPNINLIRKAAKVIRNGGLVVFPTETVYGIGANAFDPEACKKIFKVKRRPVDNPLIVHVASFEQINDIVKCIPETAKKFMEKLMPGPFTAILKKRSIIPDVVTAGLDSVAVRFPEHPIAKLLIEEAGVPIAAPSANLSGRPSPTKAEHAIEDMNGRVDVIIDGGDTLYGLESTIINFTVEPPILLRPGPLYPEQLQKIGCVCIPEEARGLKSQEKPLSPGMKYRHYAPKKKLVLVENLSKMREILEVYKDLDPIVLCPIERAALYKGYKTVIIGSLKNKFSIAKNLFDVLRTVERMEGNIIIAEGLDDNGILFSVMNRLRKAASEVIR